ncbi:MAG: thioredoxin domain-containing protein [Bryobacteraceae bacterium]|jgi:protein-disulfide isomerase
MRTAAAILLLLVCGLSMPATSRNDVVEGNPASPVRVIVYEDLQCGDCQSFRTLLDEKILPKYGARVAFVHRDLPLARHDWARQAAIAARWVYQQDPQLGIVFRREIMAEQEHLTANNLKPWLIEFAVRNDLDYKGIVNSLTDPRVVALVDQDSLAAVARGISRTPTVYVGNQSIVETITYEDLARLIDVELGR